MKTIIDFANKVKSLVDGRMSNIANVETSPSTHPYAVGKQLIFNGLLCKATSAIAVGDTLAVGTNLALSDNVVEQIYSLNQGLTNSLADMNNVLGAKNLLPNNAVSNTVNGVTFTVNSDGSITANGTATTTFDFPVLETLYTPLHLYNGVRYIISGCPQSPVNYNLQMYYLINGTWSGNHVDVGDGTTFTAYSDREYGCNIHVDSGAVFNNVIFYPMLRLASIQDDTYVPYSMTNREMTPYVQAISNPNLLDNPWFTVNQRNVEKGVSITTTTVRYWWDRWYCNSNRTFTYNTDNSITSSNIDIWQIIEGGIEKLQGRTITLSIMLADGTIKSGTYNVPQGVPSTNQFISVFNNDGINIVFGRLPSGNAQFSLLLGQNKTIKATKLELGSVSTLAMDTAPNYQQELAKCQRYFYNANFYKKAYEEIGTGFYEGGGYDTCYVNVPMHVPMRVQPTLEMSGDCRAFIDGTSYAISGYTASVSGITPAYVKIAIKKSISAPQFKVGMFSFGNVYGVLQFSADL